VDSGTLLLNGKPWDLIRHELGPANGQGATIASAKVNGEICYQNTWSGRGGCGTTQEKGITWGMEGTGDTKPWDWGSSWDTRAARLNPKDERHLPD